MKHRQLRYTGRNSEKAQYSGTPVLQHTARKGFEDS
jgi:hypothetical protein